MAQGLYGSFCLEDLFGQFLSKSADGRTWVNLDSLQGPAFSRSDKNGKHYVNIGLYINDQPDQYGQIAGISLQQTQEERARGDKRKYIGNMKASGQQQQQQQMPQGGYPTAPGQGFTGNPQAYGPPPQQQPQPQQPWGAPPVQQPQPPVGPGWGQPPVQAANAAPQFGQPPVQQQQQPIQGNGNPWAAPRNGDLLF